MSMQKTIVSSQVLVTNKMLIAHEVGGIKSGHKLIEKCRTMLKTEKLSKSQKLAKSKKNCQKVGIYLILTLKKTGQGF